MLDIKKTLTQMAVVIAVVAVAYGAGYWSRKPETVIETKTNTVEKIVEKQVVVSDHSKVDTTITKPDGTVEHTIRSNDINSATTDLSIDRKVVESKKETKTVTELPKFSLGVQAITHAGWPMEPPKYNAVVGYRLVGTLWVEGIANFQKDVGIGFRWEK
jgi:hypothetical protein